MLFEAEFSDEVQRQIAAKQAKGSSLVERLGLEKQVKKAENTRFKIEGDDENQTQMWRSLMKDCAFYYDQPSILEENKMRKTL